MARPTPARPIGPPLHVVAMFPGDGEGEDCIGSDAGDGAAGGGSDAADCGVPVNASIQLRFDRPLDAASVNYEAIRLYSAEARGVVYRFDVRYDPVERVVTISLPEGAGRFATSALYQIDLLSAKSADEDGFRAFDGAPLVAGDLPLHVSFYTSSKAASPPVREAPSCQVVVNRVLSNCTGSECHQRNAKAVAPMGLWLDSLDNLRTTAVERVAHQTELGDQSDAPLQNGPRFGVQMPLIAEGNAGNSYLLYKLLVKPENYQLRDDGSPATLFPDVPLPEGEALGLSLDERTRLREWFVRGEPMPRPSFADPNPHVALEDLRALSAFINAGADCSFEVAGEGGAAGASAAEGGAAGAPAAMEPSPEGGVGGAGGAG